MNIKRLVVVVALLGTGFTSAEVAAQEGIEEIVVSAQRREQNLQDVPFSISAFSADAVEANMFKDVADYITRTPNASWASTGSKSRRELSIRGTTNFLNVNSTLRSTTFAFYLDEFSIVGSSGNPPIMDIERIEILRGPQATYFGRNALGGGISMTSKKPHNELAGTFMVDYSSFETIDIEGVLNVPIVEDVLAMRANVKFTESDGNIENIHPTGGGNDSQYEYAKALFRYTPNDALTIDVTALFADEEAGMREGVPSGAFSFFAERLYGGDLTNFPDDDGDGMAEPLPDGVGFWPNNTDKVNFNSPQSVGTKYEMFTGRVDYETSDLLFTSITGYIESDFFLNGDIDGSSLDAFNEFRNIDRDSFSQEIRLQNVNDNASRRWSVGALYAEDNGHFLSNTLTGPDNGFGLPGGLVISAGDDRDQLESRAVFGQYDIDFNDQLTFSVGGRYTDETRTVRESALDTGTGNQITISVEEDFSSFLPRVAVAYGVNDDTNLYGTISKGYKSGGVTRFGSQGVPYEPEEVWNYEAGVKGDLGDKVRYSAAVFYMDWSDMQVEFLVPQLGGVAGGSVISNAESASSQGVELELTALPMDNLVVNFNVGYLSAELDKATIFIRNNVCDHVPPSTECNHVLDGFTTPLSPKWTLSADAEYTFPFGSDKEGFARLEWAFRDTAERTLVEGLIQEDEVPWRVPSYNFTNLRIGVRHDNWSAVAYAENLFDKDYFANAYVKAWAGGVALEPSYQRIGVRFRYDFGE